MQTCACASEHCILRSRYHPRLHMAARRVSYGLRWFFLLLLAEVVLFGLVYVLRESAGTGDAGDPAPANFSRVQRLNLQSLINAKGYPCPTPPSLRYAQHPQGVVIVATCQLPGGGQRSYEIDFKGHFKPL